jgi:hypothetical protein
MKIRRKRMLLILGVFLFLLALKIPLLQAQLSTSDYLAHPGFWPTKDGEARSDYVGLECMRVLPCGKSGVKKTTPMDQFLQPCQRVRGLAAHSDMNFKVRNYKYKIETLS